MILFIWIINRFIATGSRVRKDSTAPNNHVNPFEFTACGNSCYTHKIQHAVSKNRNISTVDLDVIIPGFDTVQ